MKNTKIRAPLVTLLLFLFSFISFSQISIQLPKTPVIDTIPNSWRGYNHGAFSNVSLFNNQKFVDSFPTLHPGIIRWPSGNRSQNYKWEEDLTNTSKFNLRNVIPYLNQFNVELQVVTNFGNGSAAESAEFVNFCNNPNEYYTNLRGNLLGSSAPINVKYWEIGNESNTRWAFAWSWLGFQDLIRFRTGEESKILTNEEIDRLYYYGGEFFREGWVEIIGGLDLETAILGDVKNYSTDLTTDVITVEYPKLDISDSNAVRIYRTPNFDQSWAHSLGTTNEDVQALYNNLTNPSNLLSVNEYSWNKTQVTLTPNGGLKVDDAILIEYNSVGHDGAFAYRNAMKAADPTIEIGYVVTLKPELYEDITFQQDFSESPPNFMVVHSYPSNKTHSHAINGEFSEIANVAKEEINDLTDYQTLWNQRKTSWGIPSDIGAAITEWNINLYDNAPANYPHRGISGGIYVASFFANLFEKSSQEAIDLRLNNHFALIASGNNFIHLLHSNESLEMSVEGKATALVMESVGELMFPLEASNMPQISILVDGNTSTVDAIEKWGGISNNDNTVNLLLINKDDTQSHTIDLQIPTSYQADSITVRKLYGEMTNENIFTDTQKLKLNMNNYSINLPAFSVTSVKIHIQGSLIDSDNDGVVDNNDLCPNTPIGSTVNNNGCIVFSSDNFNIEVISETCPGQNNGQIIISANETYNYVTAIDGTTYNFTENLSIDNLKPNLYEFCITTTSDIAEQCFIVEIIEGTVVSGKASVVSNKASIEIESGTNPYIILLNKEEVFRTNSPNFSVDVKHEDLLQVKTSVACEGTFSKTINLLDEVTIFPNPSNGIFKISMPISQKEITIELYSIQSQLILVKTYPIIYGNIIFNIEDKPTGIYIAKIHLDTPIILKVVKR